MSIESLKQQARRHEQNGEWDKALDQYIKAIAELSEDEQSDIGLINRVGDLCVRVGKLDKAVEYYERAVDLYREAFLPNNAIAVCKKIIRSAPNRHQVYLKIGQIRAEQGFLPDARTNFLTYAERMQKSGNLDESFRALVEFCDLAPDDVQVRITVADQMAANNRTGEAVQQLLVAHRHLTQSGETGLAKDIEKKIVALDPKADLSGALAASEASSVSADGEIEASFGEIEVVGKAEAKPRAEAGFSMTTPGDLDLAVPAGGDESEEEVEVEGGFDLPMMSLEEPAAEEEEEDTAVELPLMTFEEPSATEEEVAPDLPLMTFDEPEAQPVDAGLTDFSSGPTEALQEAIEEVHPRATPPPPAPPSPPSRPAAAPARTAPAPPPPPPDPAAPKPDEGYIDLGAMILGGGVPKTTRFKVAYEEPSGDENADFAKMLSQFKEKVSENIDAGDVRAHYDLGTAYKEMGLLEEAIGAFQSALRASADHLPTYEIMAQTFMEMGEPEAAVRTLQRALQVKAGVEDEFVGIYYCLGRAYEALNKNDSAIEYYDRVFALDINFADVTERLGELR